MYSIGNVKKVNQDEILLIQSLVDFILPQDFLSFLTEYGYGEINDILLFRRPDENYVKNNFSEYMDLWDWTNEAQKEKALNGLTIATTVDGDIICCVKDNDFPYLILPRHSQKLVFINEFPHLLSHYINESKSEDIYFDSYYNSSLFFQSVVRRQ